MYPMQHGSHMQGTIIIYLLAGLFLRTSTKLNAFDLVVSVALGSALASIVTSDRLPVANCLLALALLIGLQHAVAWVNLRAGWFRRLVKSDPTLLVLEPPVSWRLTDHWSDLSVRFVIRDRGVREIKDAMSREILAELESAGIPLALTTFELTGIPPIRVSVGGGPELGTTQHG
jgi:hypothetical protein